MLWRLGLYEEARAALAQLPSVVDSLDSKYKQLLLGRSHLVASRMALSQRLFDDARKEAEQALIAGEPPPRTVAEAKQLLCAAQGFPGARRASMCEEALTLSERENDPRLISSTILASAESALAGGDARAALISASKAQERFARGGQQESEWRACLVAGRASLRLGERKRAREQLARADQLLSDLRRKWGEEAFVGYLTREDVKFYRRQLDEALASIK
jgi:hypothetical protein